MLRCALQGIKEALDNLPGSPRTQIGFITFSFGDRSGRVDIDWLYILDDACDQKEDKQQEDNIDQWHDTIINARGLLGVMYGGQFH